MIVELRTLALAAALGLALLFGVFALIAVREVGELRDRLDASTDNERVCRIASERLDAQLSQYDKWLGLVREGKRPLVGGIGGGP